MRGSDTKNSEKVLKQPTYESVLGGEKEEEGCLPVKGEGGSGEVSRAWMSRRKSICQKPQARVNLA
jgi:hypothetical protein